MGKFVDEKHLQINIEAIVRSQIFVDGFLDYIDLHLSDDNSKYFEHSLVGIEIMNNDQSLLMRVSCVIWTPDQPDGNDQTKIRVFIPKNETLVGMLNFFSRVEDWLSDEYE